MIIRSRAPLRLGLAGGGTDVSPYCDIHGGYVLNATIDRYAYTTLKSINESEVRFISTDKQETSVCNLESNLELDGNLNLHKAVYNYIVHNYHNNKPLALEISTFCDAPVGSGLGSSSTLVVAMIKAYSEFLNLPLDDYEIANIAFQVERVDCNLQGGRQDHFSAAYGGFNFMEFYADNRSVINPLRIKNWVISELESSLILFFTGVSRESANIIASQSKNLELGSDTVLNAMHGLKEESLRMKESLIRGDFSNFIESIQLGWKNKKLLASSVSNSYIDNIYETAINAGALAGKVSGAGGGGFMWFFVPSEKRMDVIRSLNQFEGYVSNCHFTKNGSSSWRVK